MMFKNKIRVKSTESQGSDASTSVKLPLLLPNLGPQISSIYTRIILSPKISFEWTFEEDLKCEICWGKIKPGEKTQECSNCNRKFHYAHIVTWLRSKDFCPSCRTSWYSSRPSR